MPGRSECGAGAGGGALLGGASQTKLHTTKTKLVDASQEGGFDFLGYHFERGYRWPSDKSRKKVMDKIGARTRRCNGHSLPYIIVQLNRILSGWFEYFKGCNTIPAFSNLDSWIRMRLRSILRKRRGGRGRGRGKDHQRWKNTFFAERGLFATTTAYRLVSQPPSG